MLIDAFKDFLVKDIKFASRFLRARPIDSVDHGAIDFLCSVRSQWD